RSPRSSPRRSANKPLDNSTIINNPPQAAHARRAESAALAREARDALHERAQERPAKALVRLVGAQIRARQRLDQAPARGKSDPFGPVGELVLTDVSGLPGLDDKVGEQSHHAAVD